MLKKYSRKLILPLLIFCADFYHKTSSMEHTCSTFVMVSGALGCLLLMSAILMCYLATRLQSAVAASDHTTSIDHLVREHNRKQSLASETMTYTGRTTMQ